jgi:DnaJ-class molecular chaperone
MTPVHTSDDMGHAYGGIAFSEKMRTDYQKRIKRRKRRTNRKALEAAVKIKSARERIEADNLIAASIPEPERCFRCEGTGNMHYSTFRACNVCGGTGRIEVDHEAEADSEPV